MSSVVTNYVGRVERERFLLLTVFLLAGRLRLFRNRVVCDAR